MKYINVNFIGRGTLYIPNIIYAPYSRASIETITIIEPRSFPKKEVINGKSSFVLKI